MDQLPKLTRDQLASDLIRKSELVFKQGEEVKAALGEEEMKKLVNGDKEVLTTNSFSFRIDPNGMLLGKSKEFGESVSFHCYMQRCKNTPVPGKPNCVKHALKSDGVEDVKEGKSSGKSKERLKRKLEEGSASTSKRAKEESAVVDDDILEAAISDLFS